MKTIFKIYIMVVRHCAWQILSSLGAELLVAMLGPIGLQVYEKQVQALEAGALEQLVLFLIIMLTVNNGKIVGIGTHQQLMTGCEKYRRYYVSWLLMEND